MSLLLGSWKQIGALMLLLIVVSVYARFQWLEAQHKSDIATLAHTRQMLAAAQAQARLNQAATNEADHTQRIDRSSRRIVLAAQQDIANALDAHALYTVWVAGIMRVRNDTGDANG